MYQSIITDAIFPHRNALITEFMLIVNGAWEGTDNGYDLNYCSEFAMAALPIVIFGTPCQCWHGLFNSSLYVFACTLEVPFF